MTAATGRTALSQPMTGNVADAIATRRNPGRRKPEAGASLP